jgi:hypothetical protein
MVQNKLQKNGTQIFADEMTLILKISVYLRSIHFMSLQLILDHYSFSPQRRQERKDFLGDT